MGLSVGLHTAVRALLAQQQAMDAVAHNVANVNTPGFSRQRVQLAAVAPTGSYGVGGGVEVVNIDRVRDLFIDFQVRSQSHAAGDYGARAESLSLVELAFGEPSDTGLRAAFAQFFNSWRDLANTPTQSAARSAVVQAGETLGYVAQRLHTSLQTIQGEANDRLQASVAEINDLARQVAALNERVVHASATGDPGADVSDQRDLALDRLARLVDAQFVQHEDGHVEVFVAGRALVSATAAQTIELVPDAGNPDFYALEWASDGASVQVGGGEVGGLLHQRDVDLPGRLADLDTLIAQVIADVNAVHAAGFGLDGITTGTPFFTGTGAADIAVNAAVRADPDLLAAATAGAAPGDGSAALAIATLQEATNLTGGSETYEAFFSGMMSRLGVSVRDARGIAEAQDATIQHLDLLRSSVSGVNLDEEMVSMVQYQKGYEAAARMIRAIDEMLQQLMQVVN